MTRSGSSGESTVAPGFHLHLLLVCLAVIVSCTLPGHWIKLSWVVWLYLTWLLAKHLGAANHKERRTLRLALSRRQIYRLLALATGFSQVMWLFSPTQLRVAGLPLLILFTLFIAWSMMRLVRALAEERRIDARLLFGATSGYLLLGISGGLLLTVLDVLSPGGFHDNISGTQLTMPPIADNGAALTIWNLNYHRLNYFAFVSLTTVGYGDITPISPISRVASLSLSVLGPIYIAVVLGVLISRLSAAEANLIAAKASLGLDRQGQPKRQRPKRERRGRRGRTLRLSASVPRVRSPAPEPPDPGPGG